MASNQDAEQRLKIALADRYRIEREVGRGGMATVYLAQDLKHKRQVAVKILDPGMASALGSERFLLEIETVANLTHPHILPLHDSGEVDGFLFYVMPYVKGDNLRSRIEREGQLPVAEAVRITREIASALSYAHGEGVIHRDVKPANIMLEAGHAVLADFGVAYAVARAEDERITKAGTSLGTPTYTSPEQVTGDEDLDGRSDQYALGCVLFEMLAGRPPFTGATGQSLLHQHLAVDPPDVTEMRADVPGPVASAVQRSLSKSPADRFETLAQFAEALVGDGVSVPPRGGPGGKPVRRRATVGPVALAAVVIVGLAASHYLTGSSDPGPPPSDRPYTVLATVDGSADSDTREMVEFMLRSALDAAHVVRTVPSTEVARVLDLMEREASAPIDLTTARELAARMGASTVVQARLDAVGNSFLIAARIEEAGSGQLVAEASQQTDDDARLVQAVEDVTTKLRRDLGETRAVLANTEPLPDVFTPSLEALRKYRAGTALFRNFQPAQAVPFFREALALDPEFSAAHVDLSAALHNAGSADSVVLHLRRALETPERLKDMQRRDTEAYLHYASDFRLWDETMFRTGTRNRDALRLTDFQRFDTARAIMVSEVREVVRRSRRFNPEGRLSTKADNRWRNLIRLSIVTGKAQEVEAFRDSLRVDAGEYWEMMQSFDSHAWDRADSVRHAVPPDFWGTHVNKRMAVTALDAARGRIRESYDTWADIPSRRLNPARALLVFEIVSGVPSQNANMALTDRGLNSVERYMAYGVRSAILGDTLAAKRVAARMAEARDSATSDLFEGAFDPMFLLLDAGVAMQRGGWAEAARLLEPCADRLGEQGYGFISDRFLIRWVLAEAYAKNGESDLSIAQLDALLLERSFEPLHVLVFAPTHFKLGQLHAEAGDAAEAVVHHTAFLDAFTDPEPEFVWMVEEARLAVERFSG